MTSRIEIGIQLLRSERVSLVDRLESCPEHERETIGDAIAWVDRDLDELYAKTTPASDAPSPTQSPATSPTARPPR
jgi:hypothetical protein